MAQRRRSLPPVSPRLDREIKPLISAIREVVEVGEGVRGDPLDRKITYRDLIDSGIGKIKRGLKPSNPGALEPGDGPQDMRIPPKPSGFAVSGGFNGLISLVWDIPGELYSNHAYTNIYRSEADNFANAELVGRDAGAFYTDVVRADAEIKTYYYWITFVSTSNIEGPTNDTAGTPGQALEDTGYLIEKLSGEITRSELAQELTSEIDLIQNSLSDAEVSIDDITDGLNSVEQELRGPESLDGTVAARIATEREARIAALSQERNERIDAIDLEAQARADAVLAEAQARGEAIYNEAQIRETEDDFLGLQANVMAAAKGSEQAVIYSLSQVQISDSEVFATQINQLSGQVDTNFAAISEEKTIRANETSALATQVGILSARLDARPSVASSFEPGPDYDAWTATSGNSLSPETGDVYAGAQSAELRSSSASQAPESGGVRRPVPAETATEFQGHTIRISFYAKQAATSPATESAVSYTLDSGASSGWLTFQPGPDYQFFSVEFDVPAGGPGTANEVAFLADTSGSGGGILVDRVLVTFAETEIPEVTAAIESVQQSVVDLDEAVTQEINTFTTQYDSSLSAVTQDISSLSDEQSSQASQISTLITATEDNAADILTEQEARSSADEAIAQDITSLYAEVGDANAEILNESKVRANEDDLLAMTQSVLEAHRRTASAVFYGMKEVNVSDREATATEIDGVRAEVDDAKGQIETERTLRISEDSALSEQINTVFAKANTNASAITGEQKARADADSAMAEDITNLYAGVGDAQAGLEQEAKVRADEDEVLGLIQKVMSAHRNAASATFYSMQEVNISDRESTATQVEGVRAEVEDAKGQIETERLVRASEDSALSQQINTVQSTVGDNTTALQTQAQAIDGVKAQYTVKIDANGAVAGYGLASTPSDDTEDGQFSEFYINADRFAVLPQGAPKSDAVAPFIVQNGEVYINTARIREGTIQKGQIGAIGFGQIVDENDLPVTTVAGKLKGDLIEADNLKVAEAATFSGDAKSTNYVPGSAGWIIQQSGFVEFNNAQIRGNVDLDSLTVNGEMPTAGDGISAEPASYSRSITTSGYSNTLSHNDSATFSNIPGGGTLDIDYVFSAEMEFDLEAGATIKTGTHVQELEGYTWETYDLPHPESYYYDVVVERNQFGNMIKITGYYYYLEGGYTEFRGTYTMDYEVLVDGEVVVQDSVSGNINRNLSASWSGTTHTLGTLSKQSDSINPRLNIPVNRVRHTYPSFTEQSLIEIRSRVTVSGIRYSGYTPSASGRYMRVYRNASSMSLNLSRL